MQRQMDRTRPADTRRDNRDRDRDRDRVVAGRPGVGAVIQAVITSVKPQLGLFVELPLPSREFEGLVHLSEISWDLQQFVKRVRGSPDERDRISTEIAKTWAAGDKPFVRILKYKQDRGKTVADVSLLDVEQRGARQLRDNRPSSPISRDLRARERLDDARAAGADSGRRVAPAAGREVGTEGEDHRRKRSQMTRSLGSRDVRLPELHSMHQAKIINAFHDGIFVSLPGYEVDGLVHHSQISRQLDMDNTLPKVERFKRIQEIVGDIDYDVWVKIVYVAKTEHLKCECSLKMVSQKNGRDLDPDHHMWINYMRARRAKGAGYMHPEMKVEMDRIDHMMGAPDTSPMDEDESASSKARLDSDMLRNTRDGTDRDRKQSYEDRNPNAWHAQGHAGTSVAVSPRKASRFDEVPYDRPAPRRPLYDDRNDREGPPPTSRRRYGEAPASPSQDRNAGYGRGSYQPEDRRPQSWNRQAEATSFSTRQPETRASAISGLDILEDPAIKAKFQEVVAASVRQQLEALASGPVAGHQESSDRSGRPHRDR